MKEKNMLVPEKKAVGLFKSITLVLNLQAQCP